LLDQPNADLPCDFGAINGYPHPLRHIKDFEEHDVPVSEKITNLQDALNNLKAAIRMVERFV
jgi:hypothetical protein